MKSQSDGEIVSYMELEQNTNKQLSDTNKTQLQWLREPAVAKSNAFLNKQIMSLIVGEKNLHCFIKAHVCELLKAVPPEQLESIKSGECLTLDGEDIYNNIRNFCSKELDYKYGDNVCLYLKKPKTIALLGGLKDAFRKIYDSFSKVIHLFNQCLLDPAVLDCLSIVGGKLPLFEELIGNNYDDMMIAYDLSKAVAKLKAKTKKDAASTAQTSKPPLLILSSTISYEDKMSALTETELQIIKPEYEEIPGPFDVWIRDHFLTLSPEKSVAQFVKLAENINVM